MESSDEISGGIFGEVSGIFPGRIPVVVPTVDRYLVLCKIPDCAPYETPRGIPKSTS